jgi:hypothetical protein
VGVEWCGGVVWELMVFAQPRMSGRYMDVMKEVEQSAWLAKCKRKSSRRDEFSLEVSQKRLLRLPSESTYR